MEVRLHAQDRTEERTLMHVRDIVAILKANAYVFLGNATHKRVEYAYLLFYDPFEKLSKIAVTSANNTILASIWKGGYFLPVGVTKPTAHMHKKARELYRQYVFTHRIDTSKEEALSAAPKKEVRVLDLAVGSWIIVYQGTDAIIHVQLPARYTELSKKQLYVQLQEELAELHMLLSAEPPTAGDIRVEVCTIERGWEVTYSKVFTLSDLAKYRKKYRPALECTLRVENGRDTYVVVLPACAFAWCRSDKTLIKGYQETLQKVLDGLDQAADTIDLDRVVYELEVTDSLTGRIMREVALSHYALTNTLLSLERADAHQKAQDILQLQIAAYTLTVSLQMGEGERVALTTFSKTLQARLTDRKLLHTIRDDVVMRFRELSLQMQPGLKTLCVLTIDGYRAGDTIGKPRNITARYENLYQWLVLDP